MKIPCTCESCIEKRFRLHVGDRIVFSGGIPGREMYQLKALAEDAGVRIQGQVGPDTKLVVTNDSEDNSTTVQKAIARNTRTAGVDQFKLLLGKAQANGRYIYSINAQPFERLFIFGRKIYPIGLNEAEMNRLSEIITTKGASLAQQIRPSIAAGIFNDQSADGGVRKILESDGVPTYNIKEL